MNTSIDQLNAWLKNPEGSHLEFKTAKNGFSDKDLFDYCTALANEGGGKLIFGIEPENHTIVGTNYKIGTYNDLSNQLLQKLGLRVDIEEVKHPNGRVLVFHIPAHYIGRPIKSYGVYLMRAGGSLTAMDEQTLKKKLNECESDFSARPVKNLTLSDLDQEALISLRNILNKNNKSTLPNLDDEKLLIALELIQDSGVTYAALILLGKKEKIREYLPTAEIIFEWRHSASQINHDFRQEWHGPILKEYDDIWENINNKNIRIPIQEGFIQREVLAFSEKAIREALLNAITHRNYSIQAQSIFVKADINNLTVISPGGFLPGITAENVIYKQLSRNRRIAEVFQKLGLIERSGQGIDQIFETTIREGKGVPNFDGTDDFQVEINIPAQVKDKNFILFLEKIMQERQVLFPFQELYELEELRERKTISKLQFKKKFLDLGIIEKLGKTTDTVYILSHKYYQEEDKPGIYSRIKGITRESKKELILQHIKREGKGKILDFIDAFPELKRKDISNILQELKEDNKLKHTGGKKLGFWELAKTVNKSENDDSSNKS